MTFCIDKINALQHAYMPHEDTDHVETRGVCVLWIMTLHEVVILD
jgi:hypothetical protein